LEELQRAVDRAGKALAEARTAWDVALEKLVMAHVVREKEKPRRVRAGQG
jgi:hypothetical protein